MHIDQLVISGAALQAAEMTIGLNCQAAPHNTEMYNRNANGYFLAWKKIKT